MKTRSSEWSVYQRGDNGAWMVKYKDPTTKKWRDKRIPSIANVDARRAAEGWARNWMREQAEAPPEQSRPTVGAYLDGWIDRREKNPRVRAATLANNKGHVTHHIKPALGASRLSELRPKAVSDFVVALRAKQARTGGSNKLASRKLSNHTIRNIVATLRDALDDAVGEDLVPSNPARTPLVSAELPPAETRAGENVIIHVSRRDAERLLNCEAVPEERRVRYLLAFTSGLRDGEIAGLDWADVDLDAGTVSVSKQLALRGDDTKPKTKHAHRTLPLHSLAGRALRAWKGGTWVLLVGRHARTTDAVFPNEEGEHYRPRSADLIRDDLAAAGCPTTFAGHSIEFHATRRSFATWLESSDVAGEVIDRMMGHACKTTRKRHYSATELESMSKAIETIKLDLGRSLPPAEHASDTPAPGADEAHADVAAQTVAHAALLAAPPQQEISATGRNYRAPPTRIERVTHGLGNRCSIP